MGENWDWQDAVDLDEENQCYCELCCPNGHCACVDCDEPCDCPEELLTIN